MRYLSLIALFWFTSTAFACESELLDHNFRRLASDEQVNLCEAYAGKVILVVNTASKCGLTYQYEGLEKLHQEYSEQDFVVLGFPSNDFFGQEPGTEKQVQDFCKLTYGVKFPMFEKTVVKGDEAHAFYQGLKEVSGTYPRWNFHKFLIGRDGKLVDDFGPRTKPYSKKLITRLNEELAK